MWCPWDLPRLVNTSRTLGVSSSRYSSVSWGIPTRARNVMSINFVQVGLLRFFNEKRLGWRLYGRPKGAKSRLADGKMLSGHGIAKDNAHDAIRRAIKAIGMADTTGVVSINSHAYYSTNKFSMHDIILCKLLNTCRFQLIFHQTVGWITGVSYCKY